MNQKKEEESEVLDELFGASEADSDANLSTDKAMEIDSEKDEDNSNNYFEEDDEDDLLDDKKSSKIKKNDDKNDSTGVDDKILEARRDFEEALSKLKGGRRRKENDSDSVNYDDLAAAFINKMYEALKKDDEAVKAEKPALAKLKMLDEVTEMLMRKHLQEVFLDNQVLDVIKKWLEPNIRGQLSVATIRKRLLQILQALPIETVHLRESGIGKIVMFYYQRKRESLEIRKMAGDLISTWSRPILGTSLNYSEMIEIDPSVSKSSQTNNPASALKRLQSDNFKKMARSGALERESSSDHRYRQIINRQKNRKRE